jgi:hypothetical protein
MSLWSNTGTVVGRPTWANTDGSRTYGNTYPVLPAEVNATHSHPQGVGPGWVSGKGYVDAQGGARYKFETLVPMRQMSNTTLYSTTPLTGHINVATASNTVRPAIIRTNTKLTGKIMLTAANTKITGTGTRFTTELAAGNRIRWNGIHLGTVNSVSNSTIAWLTTVAGFANANSLFYKVADTTDTAFTTDLAVGYQVQIGSAVRTVTAVNSSQFTTLTTVGSTSANTTYKRWINTTGPKFFHA